MLGLFVTLGVTILTLIVILFWFVPHLMEQQTQQTRHETAYMRDVLFDMLSEQETVAAHQGKLGASITYLQDQLEKLETSGLSGKNGALRPPSQAELAHLGELEKRIQGMQTQLEQHINLSQQRTAQDNESWAHLLSLLSTILDRIQELSQEHPPEHTRACTAESTFHSPVAYRAMRRSYEHHRYR